jgi:hypothetical protein
MKASIDRTHGRKMVAEMESLDGPSLKLNGPSYRDTDFKSLLKVEK